MESFLRDVLSQYEYIREEDNSITALHKVLEDEQTQKWMYSREAGALRRLWESARILSRRELEEGLGSGALTSKKRISLVVLNDLLAKALAKGMSPPLARHAPSIASVSRILNSMGPNGTFDYVEIGAHISRQQEEVANRVGTSLEKQSLRMVYNSTTGALTGYQDDIPEVSRDIVSLETLRECLAVRAYSMETAGVATAQVMCKLTALYEEALTQLPPEGYRCPTLLEVMKCDRLLLTETLGYLSQGQGNMDEAVLHFCGAGRQNTPQFELLKVLPASMPCKGKEMTFQRATQLGHGSSTQLCNFCGEPREMHKNGRWCRGPDDAPPKTGMASSSSRKRPSPPSFPPPKKVSPGSSKKATAGVQTLVRQNKKVRSKGANSHMSECLQASPSEKRNFCFDYHNQQKGCKSKACQYSHRCPFNVGSEEAPRACDLDHPLFRHK